MKKILIGLAAVVIVGVGLFYFYKPNDQNIGLGGTTVSTEPLSIIGTKTGTSTVGKAFSGKVATTGTTTYPLYIGSAKSALITLNALDASTTFSYVSFSILGSNDTGCDASSSVYSLPYPIIKKDINWFDASYYAVGLPNTLGLNATTSVYSWKPTGPATTDVALSNLNFKCLGLQIAASSTILHVQAKAN